MKSLTIVLESASEKELKGLAEILGTKDVNPETLTALLWWNSRTIITRIFRITPSYEDIVRQVAKKLKIKYGNKAKIELLESMISKKVFDAMWKRMTKEQREALIDKMKVVSRRYDNSGTLIESIGMFGALSAAQLSGFGVYLLASTALGAFTSMIHVTLPFAVYTSMSSAISVIIGPVGWLGAGLFIIWRLTSPKYKKLIPAIVYVNMLRTKQKLEL